MGSEDGGTNRPPTADTAKARPVTPSVVATAPSDAPAKKRKNPMMHLVAGGTAGFVESSICHPLDTIKTRMQLRRQTTAASRALSSMRDADGGSPAGSGGALHRSSAGGKRAGPGGPGRRGETVRIRPDPSRGGGGGGRGPLHDPSGWRRDGPPKPTKAGGGGGGHAQVRRAAFSTLSLRYRRSVSTTPPTASPAPPASHVQTVVAPLGPFGTARRIVQREGPMALYKGLTAVYTGIVPKMAIRFVSFEYYRDKLSGFYNSYNALPPHSPPAPSVTFLAGLASGLTEAVAIVTPAEVCKIRMQSQYHSLMDPSQMTHVKYRNVAQTAVLVVREEGPGALYKGVVPTMLRQGCNQAVNFTAYNLFKRQLLTYKRRRAEEAGRSGADVSLDHWQSLVLGGISGGMGPLVNNPLDVVKTRMQRQVVVPGREPKYRGLVQSCVVIAREEGTRALWKGITPRLMRIMPGQAITFMTYEAVSGQIEKLGWFQ